MCHGQSSNGGDRWHVQLNIAKGWLKCRVVVSIIGNVAIEGSSVK